MANGTRAEFMESMQAIANPAAAAESEAPAVDYVNYVPPLEGEGFDPGDPHLNATLPGLGILPVGAVGSGVG